MRDLYRWDDTWPLCVSVVSTYLPYFGHFRLFYSHSLWVSRLGRAPPWWMWEPPKKQIFFGIFSPGLPTQSVRLAATTLHMYLPAVTSDPLLLTWSGSRKQWNISPRQKISHRADSLFFLSVFLFFLFFLHFLKKIITKPTTSTDGTARLTPVVSSQIGRIILNYAQD